MGKVSKRTRFKWFVWRSRERKAFVAFGYMVWLVRSTLWLIWQYSGARWVWEHLRPRTEAEKRQSEAGGQRPASAFFLWIVGIYVALFGLASNRYESIVDRYEIRVNALVALLANDKVRPVACRQISEIQQTEVPVRPKLFNPVVTYRSFTTDVPYDDGIQLLISAIESCKANLNQASLVKANLAGAHLTRAHLTRAKLVRANLTEAKLGRADLTDLSVRGWKHRYWYETNIYGVINPPEGFRNWVLTYGGVEDTPEQWRARKATWE